MKNRMKISAHLSIIAMILVLTMMIPILTPVFAVTITTDKEELTASDIVSEDISKREEFSRHYLTGDGTYFAVSYSEQVNYLDDDGEWQEVDNTFSTNILTGEKSTRNDKYKVKFANKANKDKLVSIQTDDFKVSWGLSVSEDGESFSALNKVKGTENEKLKAKEIKTTSDAQSLGKAVSGIIYENAYGDYLDVRYTVSHQKVKEDIILNEKSAFNSYKVTYNVNSIKGVYTVTGENGDVTFYGQDGEALFKVGLPVMYDATGKSSTDIDVRVEQGKKTVEIVYTPSGEWLSDAKRVYPVTLDPDVVSSPHISNIMDTSVYYTSSFSPTNTLAVSNYLYMGMDYNNYIKIHNVPSVASDYTVLGASLVLWGDSYYAPSDTATSFFVRVSDVREYWNEYMFASSEDDFVYNPDIEYFELQTNRPQTGTSVVSTAPVEDSSYFKLTLDLSGIYNLNGGYEAYFANYYGLEIYMHWYHSFNAFSSESAGIHPQIVVRYARNDDNTQYTNIDSSKVYRLKSDVKNKYLTLGELNGNATMEPLSNALDQGFKFTYNCLNECYTINSSKNNTHYISYNNQTLFSDVYSVCKSTSNANIGWKIYRNSDGTFNILSNNKANYALTSDSFIAGTGNDISALMVFSNTNQYQKWTLEWYNDNPTYYSEVVNIPNRAYDLYYPSNRIIKLTFSFEYYGPLYSLNSDVAYIDEYNILTLYKPGEAVIVDDYMRESFIVHSVLPDGTYTIQKRGTTKNIQIDDNVSVSTDGAFIELHPASSNKLTQLWELKHIGNGDYNIISKASNKALLINYGQEMESGERLRQGGQNLAHPNQQWRIDYEKKNNDTVCTLTNRGTINENKSYTIGTSGSSNGTNVYNNSYSGDQNEWDFVLCEDYNNGLEKEYVKFDKYVYNVTSNADNSSSLRCSVENNVPNDIGVGPLEADVSLIWRFEKVGEYYKILTMITQANVITDNYALSCHKELDEDNNEIFSLTMIPNGENNDDLLWKIQQFGNIFTISPKVSEGNFLSKSGAHGLAIGEYKNQASEWCITYFTDNYPDYLKNYYTANNNQDYSFTVDENTVLYCTLDSSWTINNMSANIARDAVNSWNGISSKIKLQFDATPVSGRTYFITFYAQQSPSWNVEELRSAEMLPDVIDEPAYQYTWSSVSIYAYYENDIWNTGSNVMKTAVLIHEIGHALRLGHPYEDTSEFTLEEIAELQYEYKSAHSNYPSVMHSGSFKFTPYITNFDKVALIRKWGQ